MAKREKNRPLFESRLVANKKMEQAHPSDNEGVEPSTIREVGEESRVIILLFIFRPPLVWFGSRLYRKFFLDL